MIIDLSTVVPNGLTCPPGKTKTELVDVGGVGLYVEVRAARPGKGVYRLRFRDATSGKTSHARIGTTDEMQLDEARFRAKQLKKELQSGKDIKAIETAKNKLPTLREFFESTYMPICRTMNRGHKKKEQMWALEIRDTYGNLRLDQIKRSDIITWHIGLRQKGHSEAYADRFLSLLRNILSKSVEFDLLSSNPGSKIKGFNPDNRVQYFLQPNDLQRLLVTLRTGDKRNFMVRMLAIFLLSTGARLNEALQAKWVDIDRDNRVFMVPATNSKSKKFRSIPLNDSAIKVLDELGTEGRSDWLFVSAKGERLKHVHRVWSRLRAKAGLPKLRLHDLRHSAASYMAQAGVSLYVIQQVLGHHDASTTQRYAHLTMDTLHQAADKTSDAIEAALKMTG